MTTALTPPADHPTVARPFASFQLRADVRLFQHQPRLGLPRRPRAVLQPPQQASRDQAVRRVPFQGPLRLQRGGHRRDTRRLGGVILPGDYPRQLKPIYARLAAQFEQRRQAELGDIRVAPLPDLMDDNETDATNP